MATLNGSEGNDRILGTKASDTINGRGGDDEIYGDAGNDYLNDQEGKNLIYGGAGDDVFTYAHGELFGEDGNDRFVILINNSVSGILASGGNGDDLFEVSQGGWPIDMSLCTIEGGDGVDTLKLSLAGDSKGAYELLKNTSGIEVLMFVHNINLSSETGYLISDDFVEAGKSLLVRTEGDFNRTIDFSNETDGSLEIDFRDGTLNGGWGGIPQSTSKIIGGALNDTYWGNAWVDIFKGGQGDDFFNGGDGKDIAIFSGPSANYTITEITYNTFLIQDNVGTDGTDKIVDVNQLQFSDRTIDVVIRGMEIIGDETSEEISGGNEADRLVGAGGDDLIDGGLGNDLIEGGTGSDSALGGLGNDFIFGGIGNDLLTGGSGDDSVDAGDGDDLIVGGDGEGDDIYIGGNGIDTVKYTSALSGITVNLLAGKAASTLGNDIAKIGTDTLRGIENVIAGFYDDILVGDQLDNIFTGNAGNDNIDGGNGTDTSVYSGKASEYTVTKESNTTWKIFDTIANRDGVDILKNIEFVKFADSVRDLLKNESANNSTNNSPANTSKQVNIEASRQNIDSIGLTPDGKFLIIKANGITKTVAIDSVLEFSDASSSASDLPNQIKPIPVFASVVSGVTQYVLPEVFAGPQSLNLKYQLIDTTPNAVVRGSVDNDFIKVAHETSDGKAVDAGEGDDVVDGGVGSTFITGGGGSNTFFLDGRAPGVSWSTITDFKLGTDKATIWGWKQGLSRVAAVEISGAEGYQGLTLHFENLLPDDAAPGQTNLTLNSITLSRLGLSDLGVSSLEELNAQIASGGGGYFQVGSVSDQFGDHGYLYIN